MFAPDEHKTVKSAAKEGWRGKNVKSAALKKFIREDYENMTWIINDESGVENRSGGMDEWCDSAFHATQQVVLPRN